MKNLPAPLRSTRSPSSLAPETAQSFAASGRYVDVQVALGRNLDELLAEKEQTDQAYWYDRYALCHFSEAVRASGIQNLSHETAQSFAATGRYVDAQVAQGRNLDELLSEKEQTDQAYWYDRYALCHFSEAVRTSFAS